MSPDIFRRWAAISLVAGALERRVWAKTGPRITYANLYVMLVAAPGVGKQVIEDARNLWKETIEHGSRARAFHVAPDSMTKAALIDTLAKSKVTRIVPNGPPVTYHSLLVAAEEISLLLPSYDLEFIGVLNSIFGNKELHEEARRHGPAREVKIDFPQLNILIGAQPAILGSVFPEEAWSSGLARRVIMIYADETPLIDLFHEPIIDENLHGQILKKLAHFGAMYGQMTWMPDAAQAFGKWHLAGGPPKPGHSKLTDYCRSRSQLMTKLMLISAVARTGKTTIHLLDVDRAFFWLFEAERAMPDIFRAMIGKSDRQVIEELYHFLMQHYNASKQKPITGGLLRRFLMERVPHDKIESIIGAAVAANVIDRIAGTQDLFMPCPLYKHEKE